LSLKEETAYPAKIDGGEEILKVEVQDVAPSFVQRRIRDDVALLLEAMGERASGRRRLLQLVEAVVEEISQPPLQERQHRLWSLDLAFAAATLWDLETLVLGRARNLVKHIGEAAGREAQKTSEVVKRLGVAKPL
jgi:hypothetical protein